MTAPHLPAKPAEQPCRGRRATGRCGWTKADWVLTLGFIVTFGAMLTFGFCLMKSMAHDYGEDLHKAKCVVKGVEYDKPQPYSSCGTIAQKWQDYKRCWWYKFYNQKRAYHKHRRWGHHDGRKKRGLGGMTFPCLKVTVTVKAKHCKPLGYDQKHCEFTALLHADLDQLENFPQCSHDKCPRDDDYQSWHKDEDDREWRINMAEWEKHMREKHASGHHIHCLVPHSQPRHAVHIYHSKAWMKRNKMQIAIPIFGMLALICFLAILVRRCMFCHKKQIKDTKCVVAPEVFVVNDKPDIPESKQDTLSLPPPYEEDIKKTGVLMGPVVTSYEEEQEKMKKSLPDVNA